MKIKGLTELIENKTASLFKHISLLEKQGNSLQEVINIKDDRLFQLNETVKGSALLFQKQINIIDNLTHQLDGEKKQNTDNQDYQSHLKTDLKRLAGDRKDLTAQLKDLTNLSEQNTNLRDQELTELRTKITALEKANKGLISDKASEILTNARFRKENSEIIIERDNLKQEIAQIKPNCLNAEELKVVEGLRNFFDAFSIKFPLNSSFEIIDKFVENSLQASVEFKKTFSNTDVLPLLGRAYSLWSYLIPNLLTVCNKYKVELEKEKGRWDK